MKSRELVLAGYVALPEVARHFDIDLTTLHILNPALRKPVIRGQKYVPSGYRLRLPDKSDENWEKLIAELPQKFYKHDQKHSRIYTVQRGDTAGEIARNHGVKLADLIAANNLDFRATIYVDQNLRIPLTDEKPVLVAKLEPRQSQVKKGDESLQHKETGPVLADRSIGQPRVDVDQIMPLPAAEKQPIMVADLESDRVEEKTVTESFQVELHEKVIEVAPSPMPASTESLETEIKDATESQPLEITSDTQTSQSSAEMDSEQLQPVVSQPQVNPEIVQGHLTVDRAWIQNGKPVGVIRVEVEETLGHYADWLGVPTREIRRLNGLRYGRILHLNQKVTIPLHRITKEEFEEKRFEYHKELAEDFFASYRIEKVYTYSIKKGDNIWTLSREEFEVPLWLIKRYNSGVDFNALVPSQKLLIPFVEKNV
jgi:membrane-bound lytic murein transglycosylase D